MQLTRRTVLTGTMASAASGMAGAGPAKRQVDDVVVGAGVFGAWTAEHLRRAGRRVLLVDHMGPANARASSGGESRLTRSTYGRDAIYTRMAHTSLAAWQALSHAASLSLFHPCGILFFFDRLADYARDSIAVHHELGLPLQVLEGRELSRRWPQIDFTGIELGLYEPAYGALMARRSVEELVRRFVAQGGAYRLAQAAPGKNGRSVHLNGEALEAENIIYACGPWLAKLFPDILGERIFVTRQEIAFIAPPDGDQRYEAAALPGWADFNGGDLYYGFPNLEGRGFKIARDHHGPAFDPDTGNRQMSEAGLALLRAYLERRFPALAKRPLTEVRICQYENSSNGDFLIDRHPAREGCWLVGAGSGHGFKHGPEVGRMAAELVLGRAALPEPRFTLQSKSTVQRREVL